jgi:hypothetical protein
MRSKEIGYPLVEQEDFFVCLLVGIPIDVELLRLVFLSLSFI